MKFLLFLVCATININVYSQTQVTYKSLEGVWSYFHIIPDVFAKDRMIATEQRLIFVDSQDVILCVLVKEKEYHQNTVYNLQYSLSLKDNVPYLTLFSSESDQVLGAYIRMPYRGSLEMASDPGFVRQNQLYQRKDFLNELPIDANQENN